MAETTSSTNGDTCEPLKEQFMELCRELNMDIESQETAWGSYSKIDRSYILEGEKRHWMACALYVACRQSEVPTTDKKSTIEGNGVSLTSLLRKTKLSLHNFFQKMDKWLDMTHLGEMFRKRMSMLEGNFNVSSIVFKKTEGLFYEVFKEPDESHGKAKGRSRKKQVCSVHDIFNFCWTLHVRAKGNFPAIGDDLVNSYHLFLCCLDLMFINSLTSKGRKELLNPKFEGLPEDYKTKDFNDDDLPSAIDNLCKKYDGLPKESKEIREHHFKPFIRKLFTNKVLKGNPETLTGLLESGNFEYNWKHINQDYDEYVLSSGEIDERLFLGEDANIEIGTPLKSAQASDEVDETGRSHLKRNLQEHFERTSSAPLTPLTGRKYLREKDNGGFTPISNATQSVSRLQNHLLGHKAAPSEALNTMFNECKQNPKEEVDRIISELEAIFRTSYTQPSFDRPQSPCSTMEFASNRWKLALVLFYKVLENIMKTEKKIKPTVDAGIIICQELFIKALMACCLEIVISSYNSQKTFPWILRPFELSPFHFYKIIEVVIREEEGLSRDVVKHLNKIEENILERYAWEENSVLYEALKNAGDKVPSCENVCGAPPVQTDVPLTFPPGTILSPIMQRPVYKVSGDKIVGYPQQSPTATISDRFGTVSMNSAKRTLFSASASPNSPNVPGSVTNMNVSPQKATVLGTLSGKFVIQPTKGTAGGRVPIQLMIASPSASPSKSPAKYSDKGSPMSKGASRTGSPAKAKPKTSALGLFFRKVYHLASVRMSDLCSKLNISSDLQQKIWTCFEYALVNRIFLMKDRHLDQMLMCAIYVMCKVTKEDKTFHDIMRCYRQQPQANSDVYRHVFISRKEKPKNETSTSTANEDQSAVAPSSPDKAARGNEEQKLTPTRSTRAASKANKDDSKSIQIKTEPQEEATDQNDTEATYGDLIEFYNHVYVKEIKDFALKFAQSNRSLEAPPLSPLPIRRRQQASPRKVSNRHQIYVSPIKDVTTTPRSHLLYCFDESPARRLQDINKMIKHGQSADASRRRKITMQDTDDDSMPSPPKKIDPNFVQQRIQALKSDRNFR